MKLVDVEGLDCSSCFYWSPIPGTKAGTCRYMPPVTTSPDCEPSWPITGRGDVCGKWHTDQEPPHHLGLAEYSDAMQPPVCGVTVIENGVEVACPNHLPCPSHKYAQHLVDVVQGRQVAAGLPPFAPDVIDRAQQTTPRGDAWDSGA